MSCLCAAYRLYTVVPRLVKFVDMLTNWYVRTNRRRLKVRQSEKKINTGDASAGTTCFMEAQKIFLMLFVASRECFKARLVVKATGFGSS